MSEEERQEDGMSESREDRKSESPEKVNGELSIGKTDTPKEISKSEIPTSEIKNMEVHHHPEVEKKGFKEYLLEGLMIFVAVTMGFFAESLREHINDTEKEKEYIISLISDLKQDTSGLKSTISENKTKLDMLDSLNNLSNKNIDDQNTRIGLYRKLNFIHFTSTFGSNDATMMQLKNAGGLRLIKQPHVADSIANYDMEMRSIYAAESAYLRTINDAIAISQEILDYNCLKDSNYYKNGKFTDKTLPLLDNDPKKIKIFFNKINTEWGWTENYLENLHKRIPVAERLISFLKKQYHLDNE